MAKDNIMKSILIVEDDITFGMMLKTWLGKKGFEVDSASNIARAKRCIEAQMPDLILSDLRLPDQDGIHLLKWMNEQHMDIPLIIMTGYADIQSAVQAIKLGARDYIAKPVNPEELLKKMSEALQGKENGKPVSDKQPSAQKQHSVTSDKRHAYLEGESDAAKQLYNYVGLVAPTNMSVLINGASGTGKEYIAHRIHQLSKRADKPFIAIDCGSIPKELAASEFFGHIKGSFTGALTDKTGAFVAANGGTIFLDEIGNLSYEVQIQLLRALQERRIRPLGSTQEVTVATTEKVTESATTAVVNSGNNNTQAVQIVNSDGTSSNLTGATASGTTYTVKSGDTGEKICKSVYGEYTKENWSKILKANNMNESSTYHPGQELIIP